LNTVLHFIWLPW